MVPQEQLKSQRVRVLLVEDEWFIRFKRRRAASRRGV